MDILLINLILENQLIHPANPSNPLNPAQKNTFPDSAGKVLT
jgi:hypothetical protein